VASTNDCERSTRDYGRLRTDGASAGRGSHGNAHGAFTSGRDDWGHGANLTAAPRGGSRGGGGGGGRGGRGSRELSDYHVSFDPL